MLHTSRIYFCYVHLKKCIFYNLPRHFFLRVPMCGYSNVVSASVCAHGFILQPPFPPPPLPNSPPLNTPPLFCAAQY